MYIGIDIGGTTCAVLLADASGHVHRRVQFETTTQEQTLTRIINAVASLGPADAIGISCGGPLDAARGVLFSPPNLPGWGEVPITDILTRRFGIPAYLQNDANACALAEWTFGAGVGCRNMIFLTFGTGMGAGLILNGQLYEGSCGNAGEVGHMRLRSYGPVGFGKCGSFEGFCSGGGLKQLGQMRARERLQMGQSVGYCRRMEELDDISAKSIAEAAAKGDADAIAVYALCGEHLGLGLSYLVDILNPERIVIGSIYARATHLLCRSMQATLEREALTSSLAVCRVVPAGLGDRIGDYAAICTARNAHQGGPSCCTSL